MTSLGFGPFKQYFKSSEKLKQDDYISTPRHTPDIRAYITHMPDILKSFLNILYFVPAGGYFSVQKIRELAYRFEFLSSQCADIPVISVGNIALGGSGKTPFTIYLAEQLSSLGYLPAIVSRGYKGKYREPFMVVSWGDGSGPIVPPDVSGDEPNLMAQRLKSVPVIVARKRLDGCRAAKGLGCDVVALDDGFQHLPLKRDLNLALLTGNEDYLFPLGSLREPKSALRRADLFILPKGQDPKPDVIDIIGNKSIFHFEVVPSGILTSDGILIGITEPAFTKVVLASAIANPHRFRSTAERLGWQVIDHMAFPDHHQFSQRDFESIAEAAGPLPVIVTEKDLVKLPGSFVGSQKTYALVVNLVLEEEEQFLNLVQQVLGRDRQA